MSKQQLIVALLSLGGLLALGTAPGGCAQAGSSAARPSARSADLAPDEPSIPPRDLMRGLVVPQRNTLVEGLQLGPRTDAEWESLRLSTSLLREASLILLRERPADDPVWGRAAGQMLRDGSGHMLAALEQRDLAGARQAYDQMSRACATCHRECPSGEHPLSTLSR